MNRRDFIKASALAGLAIAAPLPFSKMARAETLGPYQGPLWITINATGGWDPTMVCDPKGNTINQSFNEGDILQYRNLKVAPNPNTPSLQSWFETYYKDILVINGIDTATLNHGPGRRNIWSGQLGDGNPNVAALVAACAQPDAPMAFINEGGFEDTAGVITATRANSNNLGFFKKMANPNYVDKEGTGTYFEDDVLEVMHEARKARLERQLSGKTLPRVKHSLSTLNIARMGQGKLKKLLTHLENPQGNTQLIRQAKLVLAAYEAGLAVSAHLSVSGFDTHGDHDNTQGMALEELFEGVKFITDEVVSRGMEDNVIIAISSDFARRPVYNGGNGKDHWAYTSMVLYGPGHFKGNRVAGGTTQDGQDATRVDPNDIFGSTYSDADQSKTRIRPSHIHQAMRDLAGISENPVTQNFPLMTDVTMPFFS